VELVEPTGLGTVAHLDLDGQLLKLFTTDRPPIAIGDIVGLRLAPEDLRLFDPETGVRLRTG
jgi:multiple sugar transport system ATP-binding protein